VPHGDARAGNKVAETISRRKRVADCLTAGIIPMQKTKKSVSKRFKVTATGKLIRRTPGYRHLLGAKSTKAKRRATRDKLVAPGHAAALMQCLPFGR
jgi:large subunit ribosomal protein L35